MNATYRLLSCLLALACVALAADGIPKGREVLISEFALVPAPGSEGTWVELYNRSAENVDVGRHSLTCNGKRLVTFPGLFVLPGHSLLLVRFTATHAKGWAVTEGPANTRVATVPVAVAARTGTIRVGSGFLALECPSRGGMDRLVDYVRWGNTRLAFDKSYQARAVHAGLWPRSGGQPLSTALPDEAPNPPPPLAARGLCRLSFLPSFDQGQAWVVLPAASATPGAGNLELPSPELDVLNGETRYAGDGLSVKARLPVTPGRGDVLSKAVFRFQLALDPHFEQIVSAIDSATAEHTFPEKVVPPGAYFVRVRWLTPGIGTRWCDPVHLRAR